MNTHALEWRVNSASSGVTVKSEYWDQTFWSEIRVFVYRIGTTYPLDANSGVHV